MSSYLWIIPFDPLFGAVFLIVDALFGLQTREDEADIQWPHALIAVFIKSNGAAYRSDFGPGTVQGRQ